MTPEMSMATCSTPVTESSETASVFQGKKQETNAGAKAKMPDHYRCTITCAFRGKKKKHYGDEC